MSEYTIEYHDIGRYGGRNNLQGVHQKPLPYAVMVNGKGGLQIAGYVSQELADILRSLMQQDLFPAYMYTACLPGR